jgi:hypothetical protein
MDACDSLPSLPNTGSVLLATDDAGEVPVRYLEPLPDSWQGAAIPNWASQSKKFQEIVGEAFDHSPTLLWRPLLTVAIQEQDVVSGGGMWNPQTYVGNCYIT